jgi:hypothetical protein
LNPHRFRLALVPLEPRAVPTTYAIGPGTHYPALHDFNWHSLAPGDTVEVYYQPQPYQDKVQLANSGTADAPIRVVGIPDPWGNLPRLNAAGAVESADSSYFSSQMATEGVFTVVPSKWNTSVEYVEIEGFEIYNANRENYFFNTQGQKIYWNSGAAAVAFYNARNVTVSACVIHDNENGLFGKSDGSVAGTLRNIVINANTVFNNGRAGEDHYHNAYLEGIDTVYQFNTFGPPVAGSAGNNVKDRSAGLVFRYNVVEGGVRLMDLVDPDDGAPLITQVPSFGKTYVYGNVFINPLWGGAASMIHFGYDADPANAQRQLYFFYNTVVNMNDQTAGGRWYTYVFNVDGPAQSVYAADNIFHSYCPNPDHWSGDFYFMANNGNLQLQSNWAPSWAQPGSVNSLTGWDTMLTGTAPGFVNVNAGDYRLTTGSPCRRAAHALPRELAGFPVDYQYDPRFGAWQVRDSANNLGAIEDVWS